MCASVFYQDLTQEFVNHYIELMKEDPTKVDPMYDHNAKLVVGNEVLKGHDDVCNKIHKMGPFECKNTFWGQPYGQNGDVLITAKMKVGLHEYVSTFILHEIESQKHRFAIILQVIHPIS